MKDFSENPRGEKKIKQLALLLLPLYFPPQNSWHDMCTVTLCASGARQHDKQDKANNSTHPLEKQCRLICILTYRR